MAQRFYKGRTNNHLTFAMVGSTDFATPYSAASAATKIKIYGKLRAAAGVNFVSSGAGSLTNDITHVGASALGLYSIGLAKADLSDASAAWYDQYIISLSCTGCAYQAIVAEGVIDDSTTSGVISDIYSALLLTQSLASDAASAAIQGNSRVLLVQSLASDAWSAASNANSMLIAGTFALGASNISDVASRVWGEKYHAHSLASSFGSLFSVIGTITQGALSVSNISDIASRVWGEKYHAHSLASSFGSLFSVMATNDAAAASRVLLNKSAISDIQSYLLVMSGVQSDVYSLLSDLQSDFQSRVPKAVATNSQLSDLHSDLKSYLTVMSGVQSDIYSALLAPGASFTSDIASAVWAHAIGTRVDSRLLLTQSLASDAASAAIQGNSRILLTQSLASDAWSAASNVNSMLIAGTFALGTSNLSDVASRVWGAKYHANSLASTFGSLFSVMATNDAAAASRALLVQSDTSDIKSFLTIMSGVQSDLYSLLSDVQSDFQSRVPKLVANNSQLSDLASDIKSAITAKVLSTSEISDIASRVWGEKYHAHSLASTFGSLFSVVATNAAAGASRALLVQSQASDIQSYLAIMSGVQSDVYSLLASRVTKLVATGSQLSDLHSDLKSYLAVMSGVLSDTYSLASDLQSDFQSKVPKRVATDSQLSDMASDLKSAIVAKVLSTSELSDIASRVWGEHYAAHSLASTFGSLLSVIGTNAGAASSRALLVQSQASDIQSYLAVMSGVQSDVYSLLASRVPKLTANKSQLSDLASDLKSYLAVMSGIQSDVYSLVSHLNSGVQSRVPTLVASSSQLAAVQSDLKSQIGALTFTFGASEISDIASAVYDALVSDLSDIYSAAQQLNSRALIAQSYLSDIRSHVSDLQSDFQSRVPKLVATNSQASHLASDLKSAIGNVSVALTASDISDIASAVAAAVTTITASDISDIASAVYANLSGSLSAIRSATAQGNSIALVNQSGISDTYSLLSDFRSDVLSRVPKVVANYSQLSDVHSDLKSQIGALTFTFGASEISDIASAVYDVLSSDLSDIASAARQTNSRVLLNQSYLSDIRSHLSDVQSDFQSRVPKLVATSSQAVAIQSDLKSQIAAVAGVDASIYSLLSDVRSDFQSRVPKRVATDSQLSDLASDLKSAIGNVSVTIGASDISDIASAVIANLPSISASDITSIANAVESAVASDLSDIYSAVLERAVPGDAMALTSGERADIANAILDLTNAIETGLTPRGTLRLMAAALAGKLSGAAGTTVTIRNAVADSKPRITATVDSSGNRTAISTDTA